MCNGLEQYQDKTLIYEEEHEIIFWFTVCLMSILIFCILRVVGILSSISGKNSWIYRSCLG